jgi:homoserine kinase type II
MKSRELDDEVRFVLGRYPQAYQPSLVEYLGSAGGFSGADFWRVTVADGLLCLRRWPAEHPTVGQLSEIHRVLAHVFRAGVRVVPAPMPTVDGSTFVRCGARLWELARWLPGVADYRKRPSSERLVEAATSLALFHRAAATLPGISRRAASSPGLQKRYHQLVGLMEGGARELAEYRPPREWPDLEPRAAVLIEHFHALAPRVAAVLRNVLRRTVPLQPCMRDIWHDHVLFEGDRVTGLIDFGAMRVESVTGDIARLFGSLAADDRAAWRTALAAYGSVRALSTDEQALIAPFDQSTVLLAGMNWLRWIYVEQRTFSARRTILERLDVTIHRLNHLRENRGE